MKIKGHSEADIFKWRGKDGSPVVGVYSVDYTGSWGKG